MNWVLFRVDRSSSVIGPSCVSTHTSLASPTAVIILLYVNNDHASDIIELSDFRHNTLGFSICIMLFLTVNKALAIQGITKKLSDFRFDTLSHTCRDLINHFLP